MNPAEAGAIEYQEPDWLEVWEELRHEQYKRHPQYPPYMWSIDAFEEILSRWRRFHWTPIEVKGEQKRNPAPASAGIIALAKLGIMPPRSEFKDIPRSDKTGYQCDEHMWMRSGEGEQWRITAIEDRILYLAKDAETKQVDLNRARWEKYIEIGTAILEGMK